MRTRDENKESAIKAKAMEMIVLEGFEGLSMQKLAKAAAVSPATIYIYWKNREDLLNQLFHEVQGAFSESALQDFDPEMSLVDGLWLQWQNRLRFIRQYPIQFAFYEQFRHSSLIHKGNLNFTLFKESMSLFVANAVARGEMQALHHEIYWSLAYAPFYALVRCDRQGKCMHGGDFQLTDAILRQTFDMVILAFQAPKHSSPSILRT